MAIWLGFLGVFTWLFIKDNGFHQFTPPIELSIMGLFWVFGFAGASYCFSFSMTKFVLENTSITLTEIKPWSYKVNHLRKPDLQNLDIYTERDNEGDYIFILKMTILDGRQFTIFQDKEKAATEKVAALIRSYN